MIARLLRLVGLVTVTELETMDATWKVVVVDLLRENEDLKGVNERLQEEVHDLLLETSDLYN
jgi:hypothetical protein